MINITAVTNNYALKVIFTNSGIECMQKIINTSDNIDILESIIWLLSNLLAENWDIRISENESLTLRNYFITTEIYSKVCELTSNPDLNFKIVQISFELFFNCFRDGGLGEWVNYFKF